MFDQISESLAVQASLFDCVGAGDI